MENIIHDSEKLFNTPLISFGPDICRRLAALGHLTIVYIFLFSLLLFLQVPCNIKCGYPFSSAKEKAGLKDR
jgi:hypothetical protein